MVRESRPFAGCPGDSRGVGDVRDCPAARRGAGFGLGGVLLGLYAAGCDRSTTEAPALMRPAPALASQEPVRPAPPAAPRVSLSGEARAGSPRLQSPKDHPDAGGARLLFARARRTWIYDAPNFGAAKLGYLRTGSAVRAEGPAGTDGCSGGWYSVEPRGFICVGTTATLDEHDPLVQLTRTAPPNFERKLPYIYGTVRRPGPVFDRLPSKSDLMQAEPDLERRIQKWLDHPGEVGASYAQHVWLGGPGTPPDPRTAWEQGTTDGVPALLAEGKPLPGFGPDDPDDPDDPGVIGRMRPRAGYSFLSTFFWQGRRYGLTTDLRLAPTDRFRPIQGSDFRGVEIGREIEFPFAFVRHPAARFYAFDRSSNTLRDLGEAPYRAAIALTGKQNFFRGRLHYETTGGKWISDRHASRLDPAKRMPAWGKNGERWLDINLTKQTLVAYDGTKPVYATLVSTGEAGLEDPEHTTATKRGIFRIHTKHVSSTMSSDEAGEEFELRDVPYVQYFDQEGYALHGAYWHDRFGTPKSHGCINLSPEDARRLFFFTEPALPDAWHGVLMPLRGTVVFVHQ